MMERFDPVVALAEIQRHRVTVVDGVPTMYAMMLADPSLPGADLSSLRMCAVGGQTMPVAKMTEWEHRSGAPLLELWGMTELGGAGTSNCSYMPNVHGSIGFALPGLEARIGALDDAGVTVPDGEPGELMVRGPLVMLGYYGNEQATRAAVEPDSWMHTGDIASRDDEGHYFIVDRRKDLIITGGFNVYPAEIERVVASHPPWPWSPSGLCRTRPSVNWPAPTWCSALTPRRPRPRSSSTAVRTWPRTSGRARCVSCPTCPRPRRAR